MDRAHQNRRLTGRDTIADLQGEADGIMMTCWCGSATALPFYVLGRTHGVRQDATLADVLRRLRCKQCKATGLEPHQAMLWKSGDGQPP